MHRRFLIGLWFLAFVAVCRGEFRAFNDCIRGTGDTTAEHVTNWTIYNGLTSQTSGSLVDFDSGQTTPVAVTFTWNGAAGLNVSQTSGSSDGESQPRPGTPAHEVFGGIVDFSNRLIYYGSSGWWVEIEFTGLDPQKEYTFAGTAIRGRDYTDRLSRFTLSGHLSADNTSSDGVYLKNGNQTVLVAGGNHTNTTGYVVRWEHIRVADRGDGTGRFTVRAEAYGSNWRAYPFGGFMLEESDTNLAPVVFAGDDRDLRLPREYLQTEGTVSDDGFGNPDGFLSSTWSQLSGPAAIEFTGDDHSPETTVRFPAAGVYELQLHATDGQWESTDALQVTVYDPVCPLGDIDGDCVTGLSDLAALAGAWLGETGPLPADLNGDAAVDVEELHLLAASWREDWNGALRVILLPAEAVAAGAQWRVDGGDWLSSGAVAAPLPVGTHQVEFAPVANWARPEPQEVTVTRGQTTELTGQYSVPPQRVAISEFLAVNSNVSDLRPVPSVNLSTTVNGEPVYEDWIELQNLTDEPVVMDGWFLTDDPDDLTKWQFPSGCTLPAREFRIVYASNKDFEKYPWPFSDDLSSLHTNFELSTGGEYLALVRPDGVTVEHAYEEYPPQRGLVSYGIGSDGRAGYLTGVTRREANTGIYEGLVDDTQFSVNRGFYEAPFTVEIACATPEAQIRYTTDSSVPSAAHGNIYDPAHPISITGTTCLRAAAFKTGYLASNVDTQTYIFLNDVLEQATNPATGVQVVPAGYPTVWPGGTHSGSVTGDYQIDPEIVHSAAYAATIRDDLRAIPSISLVVPRDWLFGSTGIYINESQDGTERAGCMELIDPSGAEAFHTNCGVRMQGGAGGDDGGTTLNRWKSYKLSFRLNFRGVYGGKLDHPLFGPGAAESFDTIVLDSRPQNSWLHPDGTQRLRGEYVRDQVASDLQLAMGGLGCHGRPLHLYLNGMYWGLYWMHERPDDAFAASYLGGEEDDYDVLKHDAENVISGSNEDYLALFSLSPNSPSPTAAFDALCAKLDVAAFIDYLLANYYLGNGDWDHKNWYATRNRFDPAGRWRWHMWDGEHVMDDGTLATPDATGKNNWMAPTGLHWRWIGNVEYRLLFADRVHKHFFHDGALTPENFAALFANLTGQIDRAIVGESARWGDNRRSTPYTRNVEWLNECNRLRTYFVPNRRDVVLAQLKSKNPPWYPTVTAPEFYLNGVPQYGGDAAAGDLLTMSTGGNTVWYTLDGSDPRLPGGVLNPQAIEYTGPLPLTRSVRVKARALASSGLGSALAEAIFSVGSPADCLRITELMYHPVDPELEFIEMKNIGTEAIDLNLLRFTDGIDHTFGEMAVEPGSYALLVKNLSAFEAAYPDLPAGVPAAQWTGGALDNAGERIELVDALGRPIQAFTYNDAWYPLTDGEGFSLTILEPLADPAAWDQKAGWRPSTAVGGSPGLEETGLAPGSLLINELLAHSHESAPDWIELYNPTAQAVSIGGWFLSDSDSNLQKYTIPENTVVPAGGYLVFYEDQSFGAAFALSENGETLYLTGGAGGQVTGYQAVQDFDPSDRAVSLGRYLTSTGNMDFVALSAPTPGGPNAAPRVGPIVISEIQYHPGPGNTGDEYIELHNISSQAVVLQSEVETETSPGVFVQEWVGWAFTDGIDFVFPLGTVIPAGGRLIVAKSPAAFQAAYAALPPTVPVLGPFENDTALSNGGEKLRLCKPGEQPSGEERRWIRVDQVNYDDAAPWPTEPDGGGDTLQRIIPGVYGNDPANWQAAAPAPGL